MDDAPRRIAHVTAKSKEGEPTFCKKCGALLIDAAGPTMREDAPLILQKDPTNPGTTMYIAAGPGGDIGDSIPCDKR